jgi:hypothetical protein
MAYKILKEKSSYEVQMFGDRLDIVVTEYEKDYGIIEKLLIENGIQMIDHRVIPSSLENVFIHLIGEIKDNAS